VSASSSPPETRRSLSAPACGRSPSKKGYRTIPYEILLVLDHCTDGTQVRAREVAASYPALRLYSLDGPKKGSGHARCVGMENACNRLHAVGRPHALISSTDGDTVVATDWISAQLAAAERGARAIGGRIELADDGTVPKALLEWHLTRGNSRYRKLLS